MSEKARIVGYDKGCVLLENILVDKRAMDLQFKEQVTVNLDFGGGPIGSAKLIQTDKGLFASIRLLENGPYLLASPYVFYRDDKFTYVGSRGTPKKGKVMCVGLVYEPIKGAPKMSLIEQLIGQSL